MDDSTLNEFARQYTAAWCSQDAAHVASFFAEDGTLTINEGSPAVGRAAIAASAQGFMTAFPDIVVQMDRLDVEDGGPVYHWTLTGTNSGHGGTGKAVRISGFEKWTMRGDRIGASIGHFDSDEYQRQLNAGTGSIAPSILPARPEAQE